MDMFKLLARSTNLQKGRASKNGLDNSVPSEGTIHAAALHEGNHPVVDDVANYPPRGTKRKRISNVQDQRIQFDSELDFFGSGTLKAENEDGPGRADTTTPHGNRPVKVETQSTDRNPVLAEGDCRRILKKHKLKVTLLHGALGSHIKTNTPKVLPRAATNKNKKGTHVQLTPLPLMSFKQLRAKYGISRRLAENLDAQGYREPTEVQIGSLPLLMGPDEDRGLLRQRTQHTGKPVRSAVDLLSIAPTGSGKTLAFMISVLHGLLQDRKPNKQGNEGNGDKQRGVRALIIAPTNELADQIVNEGRKLATGTGIKISAMRKGMRLHPVLLDHHKAAEKSDDIQDDLPVARTDFLVKADILVSTPLALLHAISTSPNSKSLSLPSVNYLILDEADVLLDPMFRDQTLGIWAACSSPSLRTSLWSATIGSSIESLALDYILDRRKELGLDEAESTVQYILRLVVGLKDSAISNISHRLVYAASEQGKLLALRQLLHPAVLPSAGQSSLQPPFLIFTQTIPRAVALHSELLYDIPPEAGGSSRLAVLHSDLSETARSSIMAGFRKGEIWILITTDLLSRGVDFRGMNGVVNYDIPSTSASYVHRVGRTGRQGREGGVAVTLYTKEDIPYVKNVANVIAASEKGKHARIRKSYGDEGEGVQQWLLDSLPAVSKKTKQELKRKGVESRRAHDRGADPKRLKKMRISTKSGYDRKLEHRRKEAVNGSRSRISKEEKESTDSGGEGWGGFAD